jgi:hypothetical protein
MSTSPAIQPLAVCFYVHSLTIMKTKSALGAVLVFPLFNEAHHQLTAPHIYGVSQCQY